MNHKIIKTQILLAVCISIGVGLMCIHQGHGAHRRFPNEYTIYLPIAHNFPLEWQSVGPSSADGGGISHLPHYRTLIAFAASPNDEGIHVAYMDWVDYGKIFLTKWDGVNWVDMGVGKFTEESLNTKPVVAFGSDAVPYITWEDHQNGNGEIYVKRWDGESWIEVGDGSASGGGISNNQGGSTSPTIAIDLDGNPYVAWVDYSYSGAPEIYVRHWNGSEWEEVGAGSAVDGGISNDLGGSSEPSLAISSDGTPYIAWRNLANYQSDIYIRRWDRLNWVEVGIGSAADGGISQTGQAIDGKMSIIISSEGVPYVCWQDRYNGYLVIYLKRANGTTWEEVTPGSASEFGILGQEAWPDFPTFALDAGGMPYVAWQTLAGFMNNEIYALRWDGADWVEIGNGSASGGGISNNSEDSRDAILAVSSDGVPFIAWNNGFIIDTDVFVRSFDGNAWVEVGEGSASGNGISGGPSSNALDPVTTFSPDNRPYVAWENEVAGEIYVRGWDGVAWGELGVNSASGNGISNTPDVSSNPAMAAIGNTLYVAWEEEKSDNKEIFLKQWEGIEWNEVGPGSATDGGISDNLGESRSPALATAQDGSLYLAWQDDTSGNNEIYIRKWDGNQWTEVGPESANSEGISNTPHDSIHPTLAISPAGVPFLAWEEDNDGNAEIYIRQWDGSNWTEVGTGSASDGGISNNAGESSNPSLVAAQDGTIYVAWEDTSSGDSQIYIKKFDGNNWIEVGAGSASGTGISVLGGSASPSLVLSFFDDPVVAWSAQNAGACCEIYVLRWIGSQWVEMGSGSASNGGISQTDGVSSVPFLGVAPNGTFYVAWQDDSSGNNEIYIRRYPESPYPFLEIP